MKNNMRKMKGFTLVELLIVIALIAILSVAVLATINPIEQSNKAKDSTVQNDAAEVMNAYERYYTVKNTYPWMDTLTGGVANSDLAWIGTSRMLGAGLCSTDVGGAVPTTECSAYNLRGSLIKNDELKDSFLGKGYTSLSADDPNYSAENFLVVDKKPVGSGNSVYVCYIPRAKSNRTNTSVLYKPDVTVEGEIVSLTRVESSDPTVFDADGTALVAWDFTTIAKSLFKCVP